MIGMRAENYLALQLARLNRAEEWPNQGQGFCFVLAKGGRGQYISDSSAQNLLPGDLLVLNSAEGGKISATSDKMIFWHFSLCFEHLFPLFDIDEISLLQDTTDNFRGSKLFPSSSLLAIQCHRIVASAPPQGGVDHRSHVLGIAAAVLSAEFESTRKRRVGFVRVEDHMMQVFEGLSTTELLTLSVGDLACKFGCSRRHLNRLFHQHFGYSIATLRMEMRLLKALSLLRNPDLKIINVAEQCGFNHLGLFNACFKKRYGKTPGQCRNVGQNGGKPISDLASRVDEGKMSCSMREIGLCPLAPKLDGSPVKESKAAFMECSGGLSNPESRESLMRNIREVATHLKFKSNSQIAVLKP